MWMPMVGIAQYLYKEACPHVISWTAAWLFSVSPTKNLNVETRILPAPFHREQN